MAKHSDNERIAALVDSSFGEYCYLREYTGPSPQKTLRKPIVGPPDAPFVELRWVRRLEAIGRSAGWMRRRGELLRSWEPREQATFPPEALELLEAIYARVGPDARSPDIYGWMDGVPQFITFQRMGAPKRPVATLENWRSAARAVGPPCIEFSNIKWLGGSFGTYILQLMSVEGVTVRSWAKYLGGGKFEYGGPNPKEVRFWLDGYHKDTGLTGGDLCWYTFQMEAGGTRTFFDIRQIRHRARKRAGKPG